LAPTAAPGRARRARVEARPAGTSGATAGRRSAAARGSSVRLEAHARRRVVRLTLADATGGSTPDLGAAGRVHYRDVKGSAIPGISTAPNARPASATKRPAAAGVGLSEAGTAWP